MDEPRKYSVGIELKEVDKADYQVYDMIASGVVFGSGLMHSRRAS